MPKLWKYLRNGKNRRGNTRSIASESKNSQENSLYSNALQGDKSQGIYPNLAAIFPKEYKFVQQHTMTSTDAKSQRVSRIPVSAKPESNASSVPRGIGSEDSMNTSSVPRGISLENKVTVHETVQFKDAELRLGIRRQHSPREQGNSKDVRTGTQNSTSKVQIQKGISGSRHCRPISHERDLPARKRTTRITKLCMDKWLSWRKKVNTRIALTHQNENYPNFTFVQEDVESQKTCPIQREVIDTVYWKHMTENDYKSHLDQRGFVIFGIPRAGVRGSKR